MARPVKAWCDADRLWAELSDGRVLGVPLVWFPKLLGASEVERAEVSLSTRGLHWESLDEDISIAGLLSGHGDRTHGATEASAA